MESLAQQVIALHRTSGQSVLQCRQAMAEAEGDLDRAAEILRAWAAGQVGPSGTMPAQWAVSGMASALPTTSKRLCPKCHCSFSAIPDVVQCPRCRYEFRASSLETPNYFAPFIGPARQRVAEWFCGAQQAAVQAVIVQLGNQAALAERESLSLLSQQLATDGPLLDVYQLLTTISRPRLRAIGELLIAMADGCDAIEIWLSNWRDAYG